MMNIVYDMPKIVQFDFNSMIIGELLGQGEFRCVYEFRPDPSLVIKFEPSNSGRFCNIDEWNLWEEAVNQGPKFAKWLAPVVQISSCGSVMLQKRTKPITATKFSVPSFLADTKRENFGLFEDRIVCHDYANTNIYNEVFATAKMQKVNLT